MNNIQTVALLGATGKAGKYILNQLLQQGYTVNALIRRPEIFTFTHPNLHIIKGDAVDPLAIHALLKDSQAVISAVGQGKAEPLVAATAAQNIISSMQQYGQQRYIFLSGLNLDVPGDEKSEATRAKSDWMRQHFPDAVANKQQAYQLIAESPLNWTMVRLPWIDITDEQREIAVSLKDCLGEQISTKSLAEFVVGQLEDNAYTRSAPFVWDTL